jgi:glycosyltransferase involved in cell wall biosynthesis
MAATPNTWISRSARRPPVVSVVIAAYNASRCIADALASVFAQTYTDYEVIVVNDGSSDAEELERVLEAYGDSIRYLRSDVRTGPAAARNRAIHVARGRLYAQLDADDHWEPDYLEYHVRFLDEHEDVDLVYPNAVLFGKPDEEGLDFASLSPSEGEPTLAALLSGRCVVMTSVTARMDAIRSVGLFDESLPAAEDVDLWLRLAYARKRLAYHRRLLVHYRRSNTSLSSNREWMVSQRLAVLGKVRREMLLDPEEMKALAAFEAKSTVELNILRAQGAWRSGKVGDAAQHLRTARQARDSVQLRVAEFLLRFVPTLFRAALTGRRHLRLAVMRKRWRRDGIHAA